MTAQDQQNIVHFCGFKCKVEASQYTNGHTALSLYDLRNGEAVATATVNFPEVPLQPNQVFIKDYSENKGMLAALETAGIIRPTGVYVRTGIGMLPVCELLIPLPEREYPPIRGRCKSDDLLRDQTPRETKEKTRDFDLDR